MKKIRVPKTMTTQHPDNVVSPFFSASPELGGEDEIQEAYYAFSHLGCEEQMWDCEGKEVDNYVIKKLLAKYESYFKQNRLGRDRFITFRVPNPTIETTEAKILMETLESIPRSFDAAKLFYGDSIPPIFEVILPMTASATELNRIYYYYRDFIVGKEDKLLRKGDISVGEWMGPFLPKTINVIPLFEALEQMLHVDDITKKYMKNKNLSYQRVFLARSDPALNYGLVSANLLIKIALQKLHSLSQKIGIPIYPILGVGTAPFRGGLNPHTVEEVLEEFPSVHTLSLQSAFKYDYDPISVQKAIKKIIQAKTSAPQHVDVQRCMEIIKKVTNAYQDQIPRLAPLINRVAGFVPNRRRRKMHTGLFGYSRNVDGITLPRAIKFTASLYSIGLPPEIFGLRDLTKEDIAFLKKNYLSFEKDLSQSLQYLNAESKALAESLGVNFGDFPVSATVNQEHQENTSAIMSCLNENRSGEISAHIVRAANLRKFLG